MDVHVDVDHKLNSKKLELTCQICSVCRCSLHIRIIAMTCLKGPWKKRKLVKMPNQSQEHLQDSVQTCQNCSFMSFFFNLFSICSNLSKVGTGSFTGCFSAWLLRWRPPWDRSAPPEGQTEKTRGAIFVTKHPAAILPTFFGQSPTVLRGLIRKLQAAVRSFSLSSTRFNPTEGLRTCSPPEPRKVGSVFDCDTITGCSWKMVWSHG